MTIELDITQDDINRGVSSCDRCPIALALQRLYPDYFVRVGTSSQIRLFGNMKDEINLAHSQESLAFISNFDSNNWLNRSSIKPTTIKVYKY